MHAIRSAPSGPSSLRLVIKDRVRSFPLAADATLQDVARAIREGRRRASGNPIAVTVTWPAGAAAAVGSASPAR